MIEPSEQMKKDVVKLDRLLDCFLNHSLANERQRMREEGVSEKEIRWFARSKREQFEELKHFTLAEAISFVTGIPFARSTALH